MRIIFAGKGERGQRCLDYLIKHGYKPILLIGDFKLTYGISIYQPRDINSISALKKLEKYHPDLMILVSFTQILKKPVINLAKKGTINLHGGRLPQYRGASVLNWQIINGEPVIGISIIFVDEGIDTGDIIAQQTWKLKDTDTIKEVVAQTLKFFPPMLLKVVRQIEAGTVNRIKQDLTAGKLYKKRRPEDGLIPQGLNDWQKYNFVRALTKPYPGAFYFKNGRKVFIWQLPLPSLPKTD